DSNTSARIGDNAQINRGSADYRFHTVGAGQGVYVNASNDASAISAAGAFGAGLVGLAGAVDFGSFKNSVNASVGGGADVSAKDDVEVNALALKEIRGFSLSGAGGLVGLAASVSVWSIGEQFTDSYQDSEGNSSNALTGDGGATADGEAGSQADKGGGAVTDQLGSYDADANPNTANSRVSSELGGAAGRVSVDRRTGSGFGTMLTAPGGPNQGVTATVGAGADIVAGDDVGVKAFEKIEADYVVGTAAVGFVGAGAAVTVLNISSTVRAQVGG